MKQSFFKRLFNPEPKQAVLEVKIEDERYRYPVKEAEAMPTVIEGFIETTVIDTPVEKTPSESCMDQLKYDKEFRDLWEASIAMAIIDCTRWYKAKNKREYLTKVDIQAIADESARHFVSLITGDYNHDENEEMNFTEKVPTSNS